MAKGMCTTNGSHDIIPAMTKDQVKEVLDRVLTWPPERQEDAAQMLLALEAREVSFIIQATRNGPRSRKASLRRSGARLYQQMKSPRCSSRAVRDAPAYATRTKRSARNSRKYCQRESGCR
jgi:hypothetical protein